MKQYLEFKNAGEIETQAFVLMGASTKRDDSSKIGYFGSGLKYALAYFMRHDIDFHIFSGEKKVTIKKRKEKLRGTEYNSLVINNRRTSITTEMGPNWTLWHAVREIFCNALDEKGGMVESDDIIPEKNVTKIYLENNDRVSGVLDRWADYFCGYRKDRISRSDDWEVFSPKNKIVIYRKGIQVYKGDTDSLFHYNLFDIDINEDREIKYSWEIKEKLAICWARYATEDMIRRLFDCREKNIYEKDLDWSYAKEYNDNWLKVIDGREIVHEDIAGHFEDKVAEGAVVLPNNLVNSVAKAEGPKVKVCGQSDYHGNYFEVAMSKRDQYLIKEVLEFFKEVGLQIPYTINVAVFTDRSMLGRVKDQEIILSKNVLEMGKKVIAATILEETMHIESGKKDESRGFQDYIINKILTILENKNGIFI